MYPYGNRNDQENPHSSNTNGFKQTNNAQLPNQAYYYQAQPQPMNYNNQFVPANQLLYNANPVPMQRQPVPLVYQASAEDKQQRYKMEQQRKFKNFGKEFKNTSIDSMMSNIISSSVKPSPTTKTAKKEQDDFGDFLQATPQHSVSPNTVQNVNAPQAHTSNNIPSYLNNHQASNHAATTYVKPDVDLQTKMMSSLDLRTSQHAYQKFKPIATQPTKRHEVKTFQASRKAANWSNIDAVEDAFQVEQPPVLLPNVSTNEPSTRPSPQPSPQPCVQPPTQTGLWLSDINQAPMVYKHVYEASVVDDGLMDTSKLYPILLQCNLPNQVLGELWSVTNKTVPGRLTQKELFMLLALIALTQNGKKTSDVDLVLSLPTPPVPYMSAYNNTNDQSNVGHATGAQPPATSIASVEEEEFDDFQDFQSVSLQTPAPVSINIPMRKTSPAVSEHSTDCPVFSVNSTQRSSPLHLPTPSSDVETSHQANPTKDMPSMFPSVTLNLPSMVNNTKVDDDVTPSSLLPPSFAAFDAPTCLETGTAHTTSATVSSVKNEQNNSFSGFTNWSKLETVNKPTLGHTSLSQSTNEDKYAAFSSLSEEPDLLPIFPNSNPASSYPPLDPPTYFSMYPTVEVSNSSFETFSPFVSSISTEGEVPKSESKITPSEDVGWSTGASNSFNGNAASVQRSTTDSPVTLKADRLKSFHSFSSNKLDTLSVQSDEASVKSLELSSLSHTILQQSTGVLGSTGKEASRPDTSKSPPVDYVPPFDDDYELSRPPPDLPSDSFDEFDVYQEGNSSLLDFDAFASFEPPKKPKFPPLSNAGAPETVSNESKTTSFTASTDRTTGTTDGESATLPSSTSADLQIVADHNANTTEETAGNFLSQPEISNSFSSSGTEEEFNDFTSENNEPVFKPVEVVSKSNKNYEFLEFSSNEWGIGATSVTQDELYAEKWDKCLNMCNDIINQTNDLLSSIESPSVCNEVVYSCKGQRFISDLSEVYGVARRVCTSIGRLKIERENLQRLHKQIELAWNNLLAFCPNTPVGEPGAVCENDETLCGICLTSVSENVISYAGKDYHSTCANFWINSVDSILPALQPPLAEGGAAS